MNAITIIQPFVHLITLPESHPQHKRAENRSWRAPKSAIGRPIAIHAGVGRKYDGMRIEEFAAAAGVPMSALVFGAVVCVADLVGQVKVRQRANGYDIDLVGDGEFPHSLIYHKHILGPYAWLLQNVRVLTKPLPWKGQQGIWQIPDDVIGGQMVIGEVFDGRQVR